MFACNCLTSDVKIEHCLFANSGVATGNNRSETFKPPLAFAPSAYVIHAKVQIYYETICYALRVRLGTPPTGSVIRR